MKDLKITQVQVDCRELSQEQIDKMYDIIKKRGYSLYHDMSITDKFYMLRRNVMEETQFITDIKSIHCKVVTYDEFINLFDKPKNNLKKRLKKLEDRIALLEQELSEKGILIPLPPTEKKDSELLRQAKERYKGDVMVNCLEFKDKNYGKLDFTKEAHESENELWVYSPTRDTNICVYRDGVWAELKKEEIPTKGSICKFWNGDECSYEIGRYRVNPDEDEDTYIHVNSLTLDSFENAKVISVDEALELFKN